MSMDPTDPAAGKRHDEEPVADVDDDVAEAESDVDDGEVPDHYKQRFREVEPQLGRGGTWGYLFWVILWLLVLVAVALIYVVAGRAI